MNCKQCGKPFEPEHKNRRYCSPKCYEQSNYLRTCKKNGATKGKKNYTNEKVLICPNGLEVKNDVMGYLMKFGTWAGY